MDVPLILAANSLALGCCLDSSYLSFLVQKVRSDSVPVANGLSNVTFPAPARDRFIIIVGSVPPFPVVATEPEVTTEPEVRTELGVVLRSVRVVGRSGWFQVTPSLFASPELDADVSKLVPIELVPTELVPTELELADEAPPPVPL